ncbi:hypothetical protein EG329_000061 [Mollisiaceae sp. DMI_Dod_QoI]|nr:hypothetical protein EG329_000061 [Helotiales sp. DMI_Dod_QoI]
MSTLPPPRQGLSAINVLISEAAPVDLERKLDSLVTLLTAPKGDSTTGSLANSSNSPVSAQQAHSTSNVTEDEPTFGPGQDSQPMFLACSNNRPPSNDIWGSDKDPFDFDLERRHAAFLLLEFRTQMAPHFPFVVIPPDATSDSLRLEKPMVWKAVMTAASYHKPLRQEAMGWKLMEEFSTRLLMKAEKSLDLLQALLVHLAWYHYHSAANPQATNLLFLAKSLLINLGYHRSRTLRAYSKLNLDGPEVTLPVVSCYQIAEISLYEIGLYRPFWQESDKDYRLKTLYACLVAVKTYLDSHFSPVAHVPASLPYFIWILSGYALLLGAKLCFSNADGWDKDYARTLLDHSAVIDRVTNKLEAILRLRTPHGKSEIFTRYIRQIRCKQFQNALAASSIVSRGNKQDASLQSLPVDKQMADLTHAANPFLHEAEQPFIDDQMFMDDSFWQGLLDNDNDWMMFEQ